MTKTPARVTVREISVFSLLGAIMFMTKFVMQVLPNIHLLGLLIASATLQFRAKALIPLYVYVMLDGVFQGFSSWWLPYLYIWLPLWLMFMAAGGVRLRRSVKIPLYMSLCGLHGLLFGTLYAPAQALMFGLSFKGTLAWIAAGLPFDILHCVSNIVCGAAIVPLAELLKKLNK